MGMHHVGCGNTWQTQVHGDYGHGSFLTRLCVSSCLLEDTLLSRSGQRSGNLLVATPKPPVAQIFMGPANLFDIWETPRLELQHFRPLENTRQFVRILGNPTASIETYHPLRQNCSRNRRVRAASSPSRDCGGFEQSA